MGANGDWQVSYSQGRTKRKIKVNARQFKIERINNIFLASDIEENPPGAGC